MEKRKETIHRMTRRAAAHNYSRPGIYHITLHAAEGLWQPFGTVTGTTADDAAVALSPIGTMIEQELCTSITAHYPMVTVDTFVVMPEHLHVILFAHEPLVSSAGRPTHLGQVIAGFKLGCNRRFWAMTAHPSVEPTGTLPAPAPAFPASASTPASAAPAPASASAASAAPASPARSVPGGSTARGASTPSGRAPLFAPTYCDVMPIDAAQLETQRAYIRANPRSRWLRSTHCCRLQPCRSGLDTALTPAALRGYLLHECPPSQATPDALAQIEHHLLLADGFITCHTYGERTLLTGRRLLPVVCHRKDSALFARQKARCLEAARQGAALVSPRIAKGEQDITDAVAEAGLPVVLIHDNGFPDRYHPSAAHTARCAEGLLLIVTPWQYHYTGKNASISVLACKTMNCLAQALCRLKDDWWKQ